MTTWNPKWPVEYSASSDENIDSAWQKHISEVARIYQLLDRVRNNDLRAGDPDDTTAWQWHVDYNKNELFLRNPEDTDWISVGKLNDAHDRFIFNRTIMNYGNIPSIQLGKLEERPETFELDGAIFVALDDMKIYQYNLSEGKWKYIDTVILKDDTGKIIGDLKGTADHALAADNANYSATAAEAETSKETLRLRTPVKINGVAFDGTQSINIGIGGTDGESVDSYQQLLWQTDRNSRDIASIALSLEDADIYPDYNSLLVENFANDNDIDKNKINVLAIASGDDSVEVDNVDNVIKGETYTLSDGSFSQEEKQVKDVVKSSTTNRVVFTEPIANIYDPKTTFLYRTTAFITDNKASGTGSNKLINWTPSLVWKGISGTQETTVMLDTSLANTSNFNITGDIVLNNGISIKE